jgi:tetratricopeptide (TPR) repeat protein
VLSMARLYSEQGDLNRAAKVIADVPEGDRSSRMDFALGGIYDQLKKPKDAVEAYKAALQQDPDNTEAKRALANALMAAGQQDAAAKIFGEIVGTDPQDAESLIREADIQRQQGHYEQALATLKKAGAIAPDNIELKYNEALVYDALGRFDESVSTLKDVLAVTAMPEGKYSDQDKSNRALFLDRLGIVYREQGKTTEALDAYKQMAKLGGPEMQARAADGTIDAYRDAHDWNGATKAAAEAAKALPDNREIQLAYARQLADTNKVDDGIKVAQLQLKNKPEDREVWFTIADIDRRAKRWKDSADAVDKVEQLSTKNEDKAFLYYYRGSTAEQRKMYDQAETEFKKGLAIDPNYAAIENDYGYMLAERGQRLDEAIAMIKKAVAYDPQNGAYLDSLAWAYYKQGQYALAEDLARKAVLRNGSDPAVLDHLGEIYAKNGKLQLAVTEWQKSINAYATSLPPEADPADVSKVQKKLEGARVRLAHLNAAPTK